MIRTLRRRLQLLARYPASGGQSRKRATPSDGSGRTAQGRLRCRVTGYSGPRIWPPLENWALLVGRTYIQRLNGLHLFKTRELKLPQGREASSLPRPGSPARSWYGRWIQHHDHHPLRPALLIPQSKAQYVLGPPQTLAAELRNRATAHSCS